MQVGSFFWTYRMARARNIKPGLYKNEDLAECSIWARFLFPGLWMLADREGRLEDRPKRIKGELLPYDAVEVDPLLDELVAFGFIVRYESGGNRYIQVLKFSEHQTPHVRESTSLIPAPPEFVPSTAKAVPRQALGSDAASPRSPDSLNPSSLIPESNKHCARPHVKASKDAEPEKFAEAMLAYPKRAGGNPRPAALKAWKARKAQGEDEQEMLDGVLRYAKFCAATRKTATEYVKMASSFFGPDEHFKQEWAVPAQRPADTRIKHDGFDTQDYRAGVGEDGSF